MKRQSRRIIAALVLTVFFISGIFPGSRFFVEKAYAVGPAGDGSPANPYIIDEPSDLVWMANSFGTISSKSFKQVGDIDMAGVAMSPIGDSTETGTGSQFTGTYDGQQFRISNLTLDSSDIYVALFQNVGGSAVIENIRLEDAKITSTCNSNYADVAGIAGYIGTAIVRNCSVYGENSSITMSGNPFGGYAAGIVGTNYSKVYDCYCTASISNNVANNAIGGIAGYSCYATAEVKNCYFSGTISGSASSKGGIVGSNYLGTYSGNVFKDTSATYAVGNDGNNAGATSASDAQMKSQATYTALSWDFSGLWKISEGVSYPQHITAPGKPSGLTVTEGNTELMVSWNPAARASGYNLYIGTSSGSYGGPVPVSGTSWTITGLTNNTTYYVALKALHGTEEGAYSDEASAKPHLTVTDLAATPGSGQVDLTFSAPTGAVGVELQQDTGGGTFSAVAGVTLDETSTSVTVTGLTNGTSYTYRLFLDYGAGTTYYSNTVTVKAGSPDNQLSDLTVTGCTLSPGFDPSTYSYDTDADPGAGHASITATLKDAKASLSIDGASQSNGVAKTVILTYGSNNFTIDVTAENGETQTYTLSINRDLPASVVNCGTSKEWCDAAAGSYFYTGYYGSATENAALQFDLSSYTGKVAYAMLYIRIDGTQCSGSGGSFCLYGSNDDVWPDGYPASQDTYIEAFVPGVSTGWYGMDVTDYLSSYLPSDINGLVNFYFAGNTFTTNEDIGFYNNLDPTNKPYLAVIFSNGPIINSVDAPANGTYTVGQNLDFTVHFSDPVNVTDNSGANKPFIPVDLATGGTAKAYYQSGSGTDSLVFRYTVSSGQDDSNGITLVSPIDLNGSGTIKDSSGENAELTFVSPVTTGVKVDGIVPYVTGVTSTNGNGIYKEGDPISISVLFNEDVNVTGTPRLTLETGPVDRVADYAGGTGTNTLAFNYVVQAGDEALDLDYPANSSLSLNGGEIKDTAGYDTVLTLPEPGAANSLGANKALVVDTKAPVAGNSGTITTSGLGETGVTLNWEKATDNVSAQNALQYRVYRSSSDNLGSVGDIETNGTAQNAYTADINKLDITGLTLGGTYYFNIIAKDEAGHQICYSTVTITTIDATSPVAGNSGAIATSGLGEAGVTLNWTKATDNLSAQNALQYRVYRSSSNNLSSVSDIEANGTAENAFTANINTLGITGLTAGTAYYFNIIVKDEAGNKSCYSAVTVTTPDKTAPVAGNSGTITTSGLGETGVTLNWGKATDNVSAQNALQYRVYRSSSDNLGSVGDIEANGTAQNAYTADINKLDITGLTLGGTYYFNIIVKDEAGYKTCYSTVTAATIDLTSPVAGNSGTITTSGLGESGVTLNWTKAADNLSTQNALQYRIYRSTSNNLGSVSDIEANGTAENAYTANINTLGITGLTAGTAYYFNIIVKDEAGNKSCYSAVTVTTPDETAPVAGNSGSITTSGLTDTGVTLNWTKAMDNVSAQNALLYMVYRSSSDNLGSVGDIEANGTALNAYTADINKLDITGLTSGATYYFNIIVMDQAGYKTCYSTRTVTMVDVTSPVAGNSGTITTSGLGETGVTLNWTKATDNLSTQNALQYRIYRSTSNNLGSVSDIEANGTAENAYTANINTLGITGLTAGTAYYFNIIVKDEAGNKSCYSTIQIHTPAHISDLAAVPGNMEVTLTFTAPTGASSIAVEKSTDGLVFTAATTAGIVDSSSTGAVVTGLANGQEYHFKLVVTGGAHAGTSNVAAATPRTVPDKPTGLTASKGDGRVTVSFTPPLNNGGNAILSFTVTSNPGGISATGNSSPIAVTGLLNGTAYTFTVVATNAAGNSVPSDPSAPVTPSRDEPASQGEQTNTGASILVNGKSEEVGTVVTSTDGSQTVTTVTIDQQKLEQTLESEGSNAVVTIPVNTGTDIVVAELNGQVVKTMETKDAVLEIKTDNVSYTVPAAEINIDDVSLQMGAEVKLQDIKISVTVASPPEDTVKIVENTANKNNYQIVVKPVEFNITCSSGEKSVEVSRFNGYVERTVAIPDGVDPSKITTGIVLNADGTFSHVPTTIIVIGGKYYAKINSLTNSVYSVIWNEKTFSDISGGWYKKTIEDMASRLIVTGVTETTFNPLGKVTRAQFTDFLVRGLGLLRVWDGPNYYTDVNKTNPYYNAINISYFYGLSVGYKGIFNPDEYISREQAMVMMVKALKMAGINTEISSGEFNSLFGKFSDGNKVSDWARISAAICIREGIFNGSNQGIAAAAKLTRAEAAAAIRNLLIKAKLINN